MCRGGCIYDNPLFYTSFSLLLWRFCGAFIARHGTDLIIMRKCPAILPDGPK